MESTEDLRDVRILIGENEDILGYGGKNSTERKKIAEEKGFKSSKESEEEALDWEEGDEEEENHRVELSLIGKLWTNRSINVNAFITTIKNVWQPRSGVEINSIGRNTFMFQFFHWKNKARVLEDQPWHFDRFALLLGEIQGNSNPSEIQLHHIQLWARVYDLPFKGRQNEENVKMLGNKIRTFVKVDKSGSLGIDKSIRIRVMVDLRKPLVSKIKVKLRGDKEVGLEVKYEKLPLFCFFCGKIGHGTKDCDDCKYIESPERKYEGQLKASPWRPDKSGGLSQRDERRKGVQGDFLYPDQKNSRQKSKRRALMKWSTN